MRCPKCEYDAVPEGARFCPNCGEPLPEPNSSSAMIHVKQEVNNVEGGKVVGVQIDQFVASLERGEIVGEQNIYNITMQLGDELGKAFQEGIVNQLVAQLGLENLRVDQTGSRPISPDASDQIRNVISAQKEVAARGVQASAETLNYLGHLAAYRRDYEEAASYFRKATQANPKYLPAWESIMWLQQSRAMHDITARDYNAAVSKLAEAREAADHTDPLDGQALTLRGYIAKTLAQIAEARGAASERQEYLREAERFFGHVVKLEPKNAGAWNGLGNIQAMLEDHDSAIQSYKRAIKLLPKYTAAYHDLGISYEARMKADPDHAEGWCKKALGAWQNAFNLAPMDPGFSESDVVNIGRRVQWLKDQCSGFENEVSIQQP